MGGVGGGGGGGGGGRSVHERQNAYDAETCGGRLSSPPSDAIIVFGGSSSTKQDKSLEFIPKIHFPYHINQTFILIYMYTYIQYFSRHPFFLKCD